MFPNRTSELNVLTIWLSREVPLFNFEHLDILCEWIGYPRLKLWPFELFREVPLFNFWASRYIMRLIRTSEWKVMTIWISRELLWFNFQRLDILWAWFGHPSETLWPFEFLESFCCPISSFSIYYVPESDIRGKSYDHLNFLIASVVQLRASWNIMRLKRTSKLKVMTFWISRELLLPNFEFLDILCAWIGYPTDKLWPFEFLESFRCSISSVSIYYAP